MDYEVKAINAVHQIMPTESVVRVPEILSYDKEAKCLIMSDAGDSTLKEAYNSTKVDLDIPAIGQSLGQWLAYLHNVTKGTDIGEGGNPVGRNLACWAYTHAAEVAEEWGLDVELCRRVDAKYSPDIMGAN
ncbi:MAG: hypothetical protein Q9222_007864, partial [Ikaeria aurantiellina]